jgi:hypothetical protein
VALPAGLAPSPGASSPNAVPGSSGVALPPFASPAAPLVPPPFGQPADEDDDEEEIIREEVVRKIVDDGVPVDDSEVGRRNIAPFAAVGIAVLLAAIFGYMGGGQIDRAVRANRAIDAALAIHESVTRDQETVKGLKSRISGAARKAIDPNEPGADFQLIKFLSTIREQRPFSATIWSGQFYQAFKSAPLLFEYYRNVNGLWDTVIEVSDRYQDPAAIRVLKAWPAERRRLLALNAPNGSSGFGFAFVEQGGKIHARAGTFKNSRRERRGYRADWTPLNGGQSETLTEYQPSFSPLADKASGYFVRVAPEVVVGKKRSLLNPGGYLIAAEQEPYRRYLTDLNALSKGVQQVLTDQDNLVQALAEIRQARRPFTFGF